MDHHYSDLINAETPGVQSNGTLAKRIAELSRLNSALENDLRLMKADRDRLIDELAKRWPDSKRIDAIGQNGNTGEHYAPVRFLVNNAMFHTKEAAIACRNIVLAAGGDCDIIPLYAGQLLEVEK